MAIEKQIVFTSKLIDEIFERSNKGYVIPRNEKYWYSNLVMVKKDGITFSMTDEEMEDYFKCRLGVVNVRYVTKEVNGELVKDIEADLVDIEGGEVPEMQGIHYFAEKFCKIKREDGSIGEMKLRDYQKDIIDLYMDNRFSILCGSRQIGKTVSAAIAILYYVTFESNKNVLITANKLETVKEIINKIKSIYYLLPFWIKPSITNWNTTTISFGSTGCVIKSAAATPNAGIGNTIDFLYVDEMAHLQRNMLDEFYRALFPTVSAVNNSKIVITSTPNGYNLFYKILNGAEKPIGDKEKNNYKSLRVYWWQVPGRYVTYVRFDDHVCKQIGISPKEIEKYIQEDLGFTKAKLVYSSQTLKWEVHIPNRTEDLPGFMVKMIQGREGDNTVSDYFRTMFYEKEIDGEKKKYRFIEFADISSWKEDAIKDIGGVEKFNQEYDLQFANGNKQIFEPQVLNKITSSKKLFEHCDIPILNKKTFVPYDELKWVKDLNLFNISLAKQYRLVLSVDLAEGLGQDYSVINIFRLMPKDESEWSLNIDGISNFFKLEQVGLYRSNMRSVQEIAEILYLLCFEIFDENKVGVVLETNTFGGELMLKMKEMWNGNNNFSTHIFYRYKHRADATTTQVGIKLRQNKNMYVKEYQKRIKLGDIIVHEEGTILEITTFVKEETAAGNFQFRADSGNDDVVMTVVSLSTVFENLKFKDTIAEFLSELPENLRQSIERRIGEAPNIQSADYSALFNVQKKISPSRSNNTDNNGNTGWGSLGNNNSGWGSLGGNSGGWGALGGGNTGNNPFKR